MGTASGMVDDPMYRAEAAVAKLITVFETVIADPGTTVCPSMTTAEPGLAVMTAAPTDSVRGRANDRTADAWLLSSGCTAIFVGLEGCATGFETLKMACGSGVVDVVDNACDAWFELSAFEGTACALGVLEGGGTCTLGVLEGSTACTIGVLVEGIACALGVPEVEDGMAFSGLGCGGDVVLWA